MTINDAANEIKTRRLEVLPLLLQPAKEKANGQQSYICPFCGHGSHGDGFTFDPNSKTGLHCFGCGWKKSDLDLYAEIHGYTIDPAKDHPQEYVQVVKEMADLLGIIIDDNRPDADRAGYKTAQAAAGKPAAVTQKTEPETPQRKPNTPGKYQDKIEKAAADLFTDAGKPALEYLHSRGLTDETIKAARLGYWANEYFIRAGKNMPAIIFPHKADNSYYSARSIDGKFFTKPNEDTAGKQPLYDPDNSLYSVNPCFITESALDALAIKQSGAPAVALIGTAWQNTLMPEIETRKPDSPLILCLDKDKPNEKTGKCQGQEAQKALAAALKDKKIPFINADIDRRKYTPPAKDANDLLQADPKRLQLDVRQNEKAAQRLTGFIPYQVDEYLNNGIYDTDIAYFEHYKDRKTGFSNLDKYLTLYPGLCCFGGSASVGKTSFMVQLADNLIAAGETVLYFSLEMDVIELTTKSLARKLYEKDPATQLANIDIKNGATSDRLDAARKEYAQGIKGKYFIVRSDFTATADSICEYVKTFIHKTGEKPIVIVDYLQLLSPPDDFKGDTRAATDYAIKAFKQLQLNNELLVILISNFNRASYDSPASYSDFKESGIIEYTADYLWTLQLTLMSEERYYLRRGEKNGRNKTTDQEKSEMLDNAIKADPRRVQLVSLKNRNGKQHFTCNFKYYIKHDIFVPDAEKDNLDDAKRAADNTPDDDDFLQVEDDANIPFNVPVN